MNRLKDGSAPMPVGAVHTRIAFREAVAVIGLACDLSQQFLHRLVKVFVVAVGNRLVLSRKCAPSALPFTNRAAAAQAPFLTPNPDRKSLANYWGMISTLHARKAEKGSRKNRPAVFG